MAAKGAYSSFPEMDFTKLFADFRMPGVDVNSLLAAQRRNMEALTNANRVAFEGMQAVAQRQAEILRQSMEEATKVASDLMTNGTPEQRIAKQTEIAKIAMEKALANMRELSEMMAKSNGEAVNLINQRMTESLDEVKKAIDAAAKK
jgi:phasin family protein